MRVCHLLLLALLALLLVSLTHGAVVKKKGKSGDASRYGDCDSCVAAGYGWSWEEEECGTFVNTDCHHPDSAPLHQDEHSSSNYESSIDTDGDSDASSPSSRTPSSSSHFSSDDDDFIADDDDAPSGPKTFSWADSEATTHIWALVNRGDYEAVQQLLEQDEDVVKYRSRDGRGALFWAYEYGKDDLVDLLVAHGADEEARDATGKKPSDLRQHEDL